MVKLLRYQGGGGGGGGGGGVDGGGGLELEVSKLGILTQSFISW